MEELCGDEVSLDDSDKDDIFINFFFLQAPRSCAPKSNVENPSLIFLDSKSTVCTLSNANLVENIHPHKQRKSIHIHTNGVRQLLPNMAEYTRLKMHVWFNYESIANILSLTSVGKLYRVTIGSTDGDAMHMDISLTNIISFVEIPNGLYCHDTINTIFTHKPKTPVSAYSFINTVEKNLSIYTRREIRDIDKAKDLYQEISHYYIGKPRSKCLSYINAPYTPKFIASFHL